MKKRKIRQAIVVEGVHDKQKLESVVDALILVSGGTGFSETFLAQCREVNQRQGLILFTDPDFPGNQIRHRIEAVAGPCAHATIRAEEGRSGHKVGIEHAETKVLLEALDHVATFVPGTTETISQETLLNLGLNGQKQSARLRIRLCEVCHIPLCNAKQLHKQLNRMGMTADQLQDLLETL